MGSVSHQECRSVLCRLSLRKMTEDLSEHCLLKVVVQYKNLLTNSMESVESLLKVSRPSISPPNTRYFQVTLPVFIFSRPLELDMQLNRLLAVSAIDDALLLAKKDLNGAREVIKDTIQSVESSASRGEPYCEDLVTDLRQCMSGLSENVYFFGIHYANAYGSMYMSEKSTGCQYLRGISDFVEESTKHHIGYGYVSKKAEEASEKAKVQVQNFLCRYTVEL
jgi:hypothetical protein